MSKVVSLRLKEEQVEALGRTARQWGRTPSEAAAILLGEALRERDYAFVEFRDSPVGRQAYLQGTRLAIWQIASVSNDYSGDVTKLAEHLSLPPVQIRAALNYAADFSEEIEEAIKDNGQSPADLRRLIPGIEVTVVNAASS